MERNIIDYLSDYSDISFKEKAFNEIDASILAMCSYLPFKKLSKDCCNCKGISFEKLYEIYLFSDVEIRKRYRLLLLELSQSKRYSEFKINSHVDIYDKEKAIQFSATSFDYQNISFISYRGSDMSMAGFKEDLDLCFEVVPAQHYGLAYLKKIAEKGNNLVLLGHSKGGNIAAYAASHCDKEILNKIKMVVSFDGPGFDSSVINKKQINDIDSHFLTLLPKNAIVGMCMQQYGNNIKIVEANGSSLQQHSPFYWQVEDDHFVKSEKLSSGSKALKKVLDNWLTNLNKEERREFADSLYEITQAGEIENSSEIFKKVIINHKQIFNAYSKMDEQSKTALTKGLFSIFKANNSKKN